MSASTLGSHVAKSLPKDVELSIRHLTHPPVPCDAIFSPPPGDQAEQTRFQNQFLAASIKHGSGQEVLVFAIEVLVYTTRRLTTVFVSKADSTGYLYLLNLPPGTSSLIRCLSTAFLSYLVGSHQRDGVRLVLSLFARSQSQYLFPGSSENVHKHILDDRGLVKWWCRIFDPILRSFISEDQQGTRDGLGTQHGGENPEEKDRMGRENVSATAYLVVPGCEKLETRAFFPATSRSDDNLNPRWVDAYPVKQISSSPTSPPRCLVPRFPDDPKARFLMDLDDEITPGSETGRWRSVNTLDQFWDMMAFRQECSAGRLVGFLWMVVNPPGMTNSDGVDGGACASFSSQDHTLTESQSPSTVNDCRAEEPLISSTTLDTPANPKLTQAGEAGQDSITAAACSTETLSQQFTAGGVDGKTVVLSHTDYRDVTDFLAKLDFADKDIATASTESWLGKLSSVSQHDPGPGETVVGQGQSLHGNPDSQKRSSKSRSDTNVLDTSLIRKRKRENTGQNPAAESEPEVGGEESIPGKSKERLAEQNARATATVLQPQLIRKKRKDG